MLVQVIDMCNGKTANPRSVFLMVNSRTILGVKTQRVAGIELDF